MTIQLDDVALDDEFLERFWSKVDASGDCWLWTAGTTEKGYGRAYLPRSSRRRERLAHRLAWRFLVGPIPEDHEIDHLCRNPPCVNPDHMEPVTRQVNQLRGWSVSGRNARKTHCKRGHLFTEANIYWQSGKYRKCRTCIRKYAAHYFQTVTKPKRLLS